MFSEQTKDVDIACIFRSLTIFTDLGKAKIAANNILGLRSQARQPVPQYHPPGDTQGEKASGAVVEFQNVFFAYPTRPSVQVLKGVSLQILPGQTLGVVGASGSGKSTLLALLERFYEPQSGIVIVFGKPLWTQDIDEYRAKLAIVPQEPTLYRGQ